MLHKKETINLKDWKRINMRNVNHLLGVEFMHNLYNRYRHRLNSIRFRNTVVIWKNGIVNAYAPKREWDELENWLGEKFYRLDEILLRQVNELVNYDRKFFFAFLKSLKRQNLKKLSNLELGLLLNDVQEFSLGELYSVNLVQIEHALTSAILRILSGRVTSKSERLKILSQIIISKQPTESQKENLLMLGIVKKGKRRNVIEPKSDKQIFSLIFKHWHDFAFMHCAYGELPPDLDFYVKQYKFLYQSDDLIFGLKNDKYKEGLKKLNSFNDFKLKKLSLLMSKIGIFRDKNKSLLGQVVKYRLDILEEIAKRKIENRQALNYYLLSEILILLNEGIKLLRQEINRRMNEAVILVREEYLKTGQTHDYGQLDGNIKLTGVCASPGVTEGQCKIVLTKSDINKLRPGDIMISIGTDFDLLPAIQKASAVVTEEGGLLSHACVVCREMGKPCCIGVLGATRKLKDGIKIKLDAGHGIINIL